MIEYKTPLGTARLVQKLEELPKLFNAKHLYLDAETTSFQDDVAGFHPYLGHRACGWAVTADDADGAWYVPIRHRDERWNLPLEPVNKWLKEIVQSCWEWTNHLVKFDAHFAAVDGAEFPPTTRLGCTNVRAKLHNSDRMSHELKPLLRDWLGKDMPEEREIHAHLDSLRDGNKKCLDYGRVPADLMARYACADALAVRMLDRWLDERLPAEMRNVRETETLLTPILYDMEKEGMLVDVDAVKQEQLICLRNILEAQELIYEELGCPLVNSNQCFHDIIAVQLGLPVLQYSKNEKQDGTKGPSYDKDAMKLYAGHPLVVGDPRLKKIIHTMKDFRDETQFLGLYVKSFLEKIDANNRIHPTYNQVVRTGRMSCRDPNSQQMNSRAKRLIIPAPGEAILCADGSQMEFRVITHLIRDDDAIAAYVNNPNTDFHTWVAELCKIRRQPAKTMNFAIAFGAGKREVTRQLMTNDDVVEQVTEEIQALVDSGDLPDSMRMQMVVKLCEQRANEIYTTYHNNLPGIQATSKLAEKLCKKRGYIKNIYGRRRHLPLKAAYKAFNTAVQGGAMDVIKERTVAIAARYNPWTRGVGLKMSANVHDEVKQDGPRESVYDPQVQDRVKQILTDVQKEFRVPFAWTLAYSDKNWKEAKPK